MKVIPRDEHCISRKNISDSALKVMSRLRNHDHQAYLVGGAVRDLLLGGHPKDFDVATDATPEEVHALFRVGRQAWPIGQDKEIPSLVAINILHCGTPAPLDLVSIDTPR